MLILKGINNFLSKDKRTVLFKLNKIECDGFLCVNLWRV